MRLRKSLGGRPMFDAPFRFVTFATISILACACGGVTAGARPSPTALTVSTSVDSDARCVDLEVRGVTDCPPRVLPSESIDVRNGTNGALDDATVRAMGEAYLRTHALYDWAVRQRDGDTLLLSGALVSSDIGRTNIFRAEAQAYAQARAANGTLHIQPLTTTAITLVPVPQHVQDVASQDGLQPSAYAWVDNQAGPGLVTR